MIAAYDDSGMGAQVYMMELCGTRAIDEQELFMHATQ